MEHQKIPVSAAQQVRIYEANVSDVLTTVNRLMSLLTILVRRRGNSVIKIKLLFISHI
jgi:hypothetical protein